jgi:hypothetical protein
VATREREQIKQEREKCSNSFHQEGSSQGKETLVKSDAHIETQTEEKKEDQTREETTDQVENQLEEMTAYHHNKPLSIPLVEDQFEKDLDRFIEVETPQNSD